MESQHLEMMLAPYNPWWEPASQWESLLPDFERPIVAEVLSDLMELPQSISITGPRRVGKSTAVRHVIRNLIRKKKIDPKDIMYFSFDDPEVHASPDNQRVIFDLLVKRMAGAGPRTYMFLDEVQRLPRWELFLKKYYDLKSQVRFVVSGSASSPIFRSSQESLLGRVKDRHLLPFSFSEFCEFRLRNQPEFMQVLASHCALRDSLLNGDGLAAMECLAKLDMELKPFWNEINAAVTSYCSDGGFPEVWNLPDPVRKIEYLMEQQVRKVLYEDLMTLTQYRKPENVLRFFVYLLGNPGVEINMTRIASQAVVERRVVEENLPRLEMTDLILRVPKFSRHPLRVRQGNIKTYPIDMALRNAVLKTWGMPESPLGVYAENLVVRELFSWPERIEVAYFREKNREVDFVLTFGGDKYLPIEVKSGANVDDIGGLRLFLKQYDLKFGVVVTRREMKFADNILFLPLRYFLLGTQDRRKPFC